MRHDNAAREREQLRHDTAALMADYQALFTLFEAQALALESVIGACPAVREARAELRDTGRRIRALAAGVTIVH